MGFGPTRAQSYGLSDVPFGPVTAFSHARRHAWEFRRGPDGAIWTFLGQALVRILPKNGHVEVIGRLPQDAGPAQLAFVQGQVYLAGASSLRRLEGVRTDD